MKKRLLSVFLFLTLSNPLIFTIPVDDLIDLFNFEEAIKEGNLDRVITLVEGGADVNVYYNNWAPLIYAVYYNQFEIAQYLISRGADVNVSFEHHMGYFKTPLNLALQNDNKAMIDLLLSNGADKSVFYSYYRYKMYNALDSGDLERAENLILEGRASLLDDTLKTPCYYENGACEVKQLIEKYGQDGIKDGSLNLLEYIIPGCFDGIYWNLRFPMATTFLKDTDDPFRYSASKAFDHDLTTSWVEGVEGPGIGQKIAFCMEPDCNNISIIPGHGIQIYYPLNNRVKKAALKFYVITLEFHGWDINTRIEYTDYNVELNFVDKLRSQTFKLDIPPLPSVEENIHIVEAKTLAVLEILEVFPGTKWDDTYIAEIMY